MIRETQVHVLAGLLSKSKSILVFTGAGISTESGISDYRSKGGLWERFQPVTIQEFLTSADKRSQYWQQKMELMDSFKTAKPNSGHQAIVDIEAIGKLKGIVTQNIDGLQQSAGSDPGKILELHGTNREIICLSCDSVYPWEKIHARLKGGEKIPLCGECNGFLKPNTISFGQSLNQAVLRQALQWAADCDLILALGSTLVVEPAASIPRIAKENGAKFAMITLSDTPLDSLADLKITAKIGSSLREALSILKNLREN